MHVMLKLKLPPELQSYQAVQQLRGLNDLEMDEGFGLIQVDVKERLFVVRVREIDRVDERKKLCPYLVQTYGEQRIEGIEKKPNEKGENNG
jgi:hypothetical protein